jgi:phosphohistidine phosphatase
VSSPLVRARETAEILAEVLRGRRRVRVDDRLRPEAPAAVADALLAESGAGPVVLVGHEPHLSTLARGWLGAGRGGFALKKAGACAIEWRAGGPATLLWLATPRLLRWVGR